MKKAFLIIILLLVISGSVLAIIRPPIAPLESVVDYFKRTFLMKKKTVDGIRFVKIEGPISFDSGPRPNPMGERPNQKERKRVRIDHSYWISIHEITDEQYCRIMGTHPQGEPDLPRREVTWYDAVAFCREFARKNRLEGEFSEARLPTEWEWEYAAHAGDYCAFGNWRNSSFDDAMARLRIDEKFGTDDNKLLRYGNRHVAFKRPLPFEQRKTPEKVGQFPPNRFGIYDMNGNLWEWCAAGTTDAPELRPLRGGGWRLKIEDCQNTSRSEEPPGETTDTIGFRIVLID